MAPPLFTAEEIVTACRVAAESGDPTYSTVFSIAITGRSSANGGAHYLDLTARAGGKEGKLLLRFKRERFVGRILPLSGGDYTRDPMMCPNLGIQKLDEETGAESAYFQAVQCLNTFFRDAVLDMLGTGQLVKGKPKAGSTGLAIKSDEVISLIQWTISAKAKENAGQALKNPITRISLKFAENGEPRKGTDYWDLSTRRPDPKDPCKTVCDPLRLDGETLSARNVHLIRPGSKLTGVADLSAVCCSNMGISIPCSVKALFLELAEPAGISVDDVLGED